MPTSTPPTDPPAVSERASTRYLDLLKSCLTRELFLDEEYMDVIWWKPDEVLADPDTTWAVLHDRGWRLVCRPPFDPERRDGRNYPTNAETMVGRARLDNVEELVVRVLREGIPGDLVETGVWRGGTVILMRAILEVHRDPDRRVWVCDSFEGLPEPDPDRYPDDAQMQIHGAAAQRMFRDLLSVSVDGVKANFERYGLLDDRVEFVKGWFSESLPQAPIEQIAVLRLDGDLYESTMDALVNLEPKVSDGGYVIVDDYGGLDACRQAVTDYREERAITAPIEAIDWTGAFWRVSRP